MGRGKALYLEVTQDIYEFPVHIEETARELAEVAGVPIGSVCRGVYDRRNGKWSKYVKVPLEGEPTECGSTYRGKNHKN